MEGFGLRVYPSGRRTYVFSYRVNRRKRLAKLGRADALTLDQARKKASVYLGKVAGNEDPQSQLDVLKTALTVGELVEAYIEGHAKPQKRSWKCDDSLLRPHLLPKFRTTLARNITTTHGTPCGSCF